MDVMVRFAGKHGATPLGDLATIICSYDSTQGYSSNSLSSYMHDLGWRQRAHDMVTDWLGRPSESLGGNYVSGCSVLVLRQGSI
jgi:hypothetical protein